MSGPLILSTEYRWASEHGAQGMATVDELEWLGYRKVREHPLYEGAFLMVRERHAETED